MKKNKLFTTLFFMIVISIIIYFVSLKFSQENEFAKSNIATTGMVSEISWDRSSSPDRIMTVNYFANNKYYKTTVPLEDFIGKKNTMVSLRYAESNPEIIKVESRSDSCWFYGKISVYGKITNKDDSSIEVKLINNKNNTEEADLKLIDGYYKFSTNIKKKYSLLVTSKNHISKVILISTDDYEFGDNVGYEVCNVDVELNLGNGIDTAGVLKYSTSSGGMVAEKYK